MTLPGKRGHVQSALPIDEYLTFLSQKNASGRNVLEAYIGHKIKSTILLDSISCTSEDIDKPTGTFDQ